MSIREEIIAQAREARRAARILANLSTEVKDQALEAIAQSLEVSMAEIMAENRKDLEAGEKAGLSKALLDRLLLNEERIKGMAEGLRELIKLKDPVGDIIECGGGPMASRLVRCGYPWG